MISKIIFGAIVLLAIALVIRACRSNGKDDACGCGCGRKNCCGGKHEHR